MIDPDQIIMARAKLRWSLDDLAKHTGLGRVAIMNIENGKTKSPHFTTLQKIKDVLEDAGLEFIRGGVKERQDTLIFYDDDAITRLYDDIIVELRKSPNKEILISGVDEKKFLQHFPEEKLMKHLEIRKEMNVSQKLLLCEGDQNYIGSHETYRWIPKEYFVNSPTIIYGNRVGTILWEVPPKVFIVDNDTYATERRKNFYAIWNFANAHEDKESHNE